MRRVSRLAVAATALLCAFTIGAGVTVTRLLPARLALWRPARIVALPLTTSGQVLGTVTGAASVAPGVTMSGLTRALSPVLGSGDLGSDFGMLVTDLETGQVLYSQNASTGFAPASTTKLATAVAALHVLGPSARFHTTVVTGTSPERIILVGGGDPTLAAGRPRPGIIPSPRRCRSSRSPRRPPCGNAASPACTLATTRRCTPDRAWRLAGPRGT